jgi:hypothetical protein
MAERPTDTPKDEPAGSAAAAEAAAVVPVCEVGFCPVSLFLTATGRVQPEVVEHLLAAGRELVLAVQAVVNARAEGVARTSPLEHIEIG